jgi:hypothetical protein
MIQGKEKRVMRMTAVISASVLLVVIFSIGCTEKKETSAPANRSLTAGAARSPSPPRPNTISDREKAEGWALLWNGVNFDGWRGVGFDRVPEGHWVIENGAIKKVATGEVPRQADGQPVQGGDLMTAATFSDFELRFEWKISAGGNSGVKYNISEEMSRDYAPQHAAIGFEYQVLDDTANPDAAVGPTHTAGALYDLIAPQGKILKPVGEFNEGGVVFRGSHGEHWLNGMKVLEFDLDTPEMNKLVAGSKYRNIPDFAKKRPGHIVLQDHGNTVWFRNIKIRPLAP